MKHMYAPFVSLVGGMLAVALGLRLVWELLAPVLVPVTILTVIVLLVAVGLRYLWHYTSL